jgi:hypothetical protein
MKVTPNWFRPIGEDLAFLKNLYLGFWTGGIGRIPEASGLPGRCEADYHCNPVSMHRP